MSLLDLVARMARNVEVPSGNRDHSARTHGEGTWRRRYLAGNCARGVIPEKMLSNRCNSDEIAPPLNPDNLPGTWHLRPGVIMDGIVRRGDCQAQHPRAGHLPAAARYRSRKQRARGKQSRREAESPGKQRAPGSREPREAESPRASPEASHQARELRRAIRRFAHCNETLRSAGRRCYPPRGPAGQGRSARGSGVCRIFAGRRLCGTRPGTSRRQCFPVTFRRRCFPAPLGDRASQRLSATGAFSR